MSLAPGTRLGVYEVVAAIGAGGMGEVYRARDTKLGRDVALKVVAESFTHDPDRVARLHREAQLVAALNHPHIATIHGLEDFGPALDYFPVWTLDGRRIVFASGTATGGDLFWQSADGTGAVERLSMAPYGEVPMSFSPDGKSLLITEQKPSNDLSLMPMDGKGQTVPLVQTMFVEGPGEISPNGRWLAYESNESPQNEIYVRPLPDVDLGRWQVSSNGGTKPVWARNGRELFYLDATGALTTVPIQTTPALSTGNPTKLFDARYLSAAQARSYDVTPDGRRFLFIKDAAADQSRTSAPSKIVVVLNWLEELKRLVPTN